MKQSISFLKVKKRNFALQDVINKKTKVTSLNPSSNVNSISNIIHESNLVMNGSNQINQWTNFIAKQFLKLNQIVPRHFH